MDRQLLRESLAYFVSGLAHVGMFGTLAIVGNSDPVPLPTRPGRASIALSASMAASPRPQAVVDLDLPISIEFSRPAPTTAEVSPTASLRERQVPKLEIGPRIELPRPYGTRQAMAPANGSAKSDQAAHELRTKAIEETARPASRPPQVEPDAKLAPVPSRASVASLAMAGTESDVLPANAQTNPEPVYPPDAQSAGQQGVVKLRVTVNPDGTAAAVEVSQSSGVASLDASALATVRHWHFVPGRRAGRAVMMDVTVPIRFSIRPRG